MKFATVCSGVEACSVAWEPLGWEPVFYSEIEDFPSAVLGHHWPEVPNHGDMTNFEEWGYGTGSVDVFCGGTPCQSFSVAGLRKGLSDERGNLALTYCRMVDQLRPKWFIWENVAGVLSSNGGRDFGSILGAMAELGYVFGWRVFDAQHFGVPQRRRRLFLVGCASGDIRDIGQVLFDAEGGQGDFGSGGKASEGFAGEASGCTDRSSKRINTLDTQCGLEKLTHQSLKSGHYIVETFDQQRFDQWGTNKTASTVKARDYKDVTDMVVYENNPSDARLKPLGEKSSTVIARWGTGGNNVPLVMHGTQDPIVSDKAMPVQTNQGQESVLFIDKTVRRLTPVEVERLQGFPDNHTNIPWNRKDFAPDSRRYKAMGNSMAVPVMQWLGRRIQQVEETRDE